MAWPALRPDGFLITHIVWNEIVTALHTWGGNVDAAGHHLTNVGSVRSAGGLSLYTGGSPQIDVGAGYLQINGGQGTYAPRISFHRPFEDFGQIRYGNETTNTGSFEFLSSLGNVLVGLTASHADFVNGSFGQVSCNSAAHGSTLNLSPGPSNRVFSIHSSGSGSLMEIYQHDGANWNTRLWLSASGLLGLGVTPSHLLQLGFDSAAKPVSNTWIVISDARTKTNIKPFNDGLDTLKQLNPVEYELNGKAGLPKGSKGISIIAQDVLDVVPDCISIWRAKLEEDDEEETDLYSFSSSNLTWRLVNAVKELAARLEALEQNA